MSGLSDLTCAAAAMESTSSSLGVVGLRWFPDPSAPRRYYFLPAAPDLQRDSNRRPMITMLDVGPSGYLMFTATWSAPAGSVEALRREIAADSHDSDPSGVVLSFAPLSSVLCRALLGDGTGAFQTIATSATSRVPPYDALFNLPVQDERLARVRSAMRGEPGFLAIEYAADLLVPSIGTGALRAEAGRLLPWLRTRSDSGKSHRALLEEAVELGLASVTVDAPERLAGGVLAEELFDRVLDQMAQLVPGWLAAEGPALIEVEATVERGAPHPVRSFADVGGIVSGNS
jgi:hypothetical protein